MTCLAFKKKIKEEVIKHLEETIKELREEVSVMLKGDGSTDEGGFSGNSGDYSAQSANNYLSEQASIRRVEADNYQQVVNTFKGYQFSEEHKRVEMLSLLKTNRGVFFISRAIKPLIVEGTQVFCLATDAPVYKMMSEKQKGDRFEFRDIEYVIEDLC